MFDYKLILFKAERHNVRKTAPKPRRNTKESHGNGCPNAEALKHRLVCVRGEIDSTNLSDSGI
jgi:hypothetical protein